MQLGSRWQAGRTPHAGVPELLHAAISHAEDECPSGHSWTLTWLEGRPRVELLDADANLLRDIGVTAQGEITVHAHSAASHPADVSAETADDEDDDDWLV